MPKEIKELLLTESYEFNVVVEIKNEKFYGFLSVSPKKITLDIRAEDREGEKRKDVLSFYDNPAKMYCYDLSKNFILYGLTFTGGLDSSISRYPTSIGYINIRYDVDYLLYFSDKRIDEDSLKWLDINSDRIGGWIGNTTTQQKILFSEESKDELSLVEMREHIPDFGSVVVSYLYSRNFSFNDFKSGISFPPVVSLVFDNIESTKNSKYYFEQLYSIMSFLIGGDFGVDSIKVGCESYPRDEVGSLYYPSRLTNYRKGNKFSLIPLGRNLKFDSIGLPPMPEGVFYRYFTLSTPTSSYWNKYLKYRRLENSEERFLGYFRILEALCYKKITYVDSGEFKTLLDKEKSGLRSKLPNINSQDFRGLISQIIKANNSKYNTTKCILDFLRVLPAELVDSWSFGAKDIQEICTLRNDITHANDHSMSDEDIDKRAVFIEVLLTLAMCKELGIQPDISSQYIDRLRGYNLIKNYTE